MGRFQIGAVAICVLLNALDGFDVLVISFASPGIAEEWGVERGEACPRTESMVSGEICI